MTTLNGEYIKTDGTPLKCRISRQIRYWAVMDCTRLREVLTGLKRPGSPNSEELSLRKPHGCSRMTSKWIVLGPASETVMQCIGRVWDVREG